MVGSGPAVWAINGQVQCFMEKSSKGAESSLKQYLFSKIVSEVIKTLIVIAIKIIKMVTLKGVT